MTAEATWLGLDIGGANLKAYHAQAGARSQPFALWKRPDRLPGELAALLDGFPPAGRFALTMTAELCDCYPTKAVGVRDVLRAIGREPEVAQALLDDLANDARDDAVLRAELQALRSALGGMPESVEFEGRRIVQRLILLIQAGLMRRHSPAPLADAFVRSRFDAACGRIFGMLPADTPHAAILERAWPL